VADAAVVAPLVERPAPGVDLLRGEDLSAAPRAALPLHRLDGRHVDGSLRRLRLIDVLPAWDVFGGENTPRAGREPVPLGAVLLGVAQLAVHLAVHAVAVRHGVQGTLAHPALEALLVERPVLSHHGLGAVDLPPASRAAIFAVLGHDHEVGVAVRLHHGYEIQIFRHEGAASMAKSVSLRAELATITPFAVDLFVGPVTLQHGVQGLTTRLAVEASLVVHLPLGEHLLCGKDLPPTAGAPLPRGRFGGFVVL